MAKERSVVKCEGRFKQLRQHLYEQVMPVVLGDRSIVTTEDLQNIWDLLKDDRFSFDPKDPYFLSSERNSDPLRKVPKEDYLSMVPLIESSEYKISRDILRDYLLTMGVTAGIADKLCIVSDKPSHYFEEHLARPTKQIILPGNGPLSAYSISANHGIGSLSEGGALGSGIRSDSPFLFEVYKNEKSGVRKEQNLAMVVGFWPQDNELLISQIQSHRNAKMPEGTPFGVGALHIAEVAARSLGIEKLVAYSARGHPIFREHPENWEQLGKDFVCLWDNSAKKLNYNGGRTDHHEKDLRQK